MGADTKQLALLKTPRSLAEDMKLAKAIMPFLEAAVHPHVYHHGYIYATMDFANPSGDDAGGPPTNGHQGQFLSLPNGWQLAPSTSDSHKVSYEHGWNTDCLTYSDGGSWGTSQYDHGNTFCGKNTLFSNNKRQYRPQLRSGKSRRFLIR